MCANAEAFRGNSLRSRSQRGSTRVDLVPFLTTHPRQCPNCCGEPGGRSAVDPTDTGGTVDLSPSGSVSLSAGVTVVYTAATSQGDASSCVDNQIRCFPLRRAELEKKKIIIIKIQNNNTHLGESTSSGTVLKDPAKVPVFFICICLLGPTRSIYIKKHY